jgi:hypothetical protein
VSDGLPCASASALGVDTDGRFRDAPTIMTPRDGEGPSPNTASVVSMVSCRAAQSQGARWTTMAAALVPSKAKQAHDEIQPGPTDDTVMVMGMGMVLGLGLIRATQTPSLPAIAHPQNTAQYSLLALHRWTLDSCLSCLLSPVTSGPQHQPAPVSLCRACRV